MKVVWWWWVGLRVGFLRLVAKANAIRGMRSKNISDSLVPRHAMANEEAKVREIECDASDDGGGI